MGGYLLLKKVGQFLGGKMYLKLHYNWVRFCPVSLATLAFSLCVAAPRVQAATVAEIQTHGGFRSTSRSSLSVDDRGTVTYLESSNGHEEERKILATFSPQSLQALRKRIDSILPGDLSLEDPNRPPCVDAPITSYTVTQSSGKSFEIAANEACRMLRSSDWKAMHVLRVLEGLMALSHL